MLETDIAAKAIWMALAMWIGAITPAISIGLIGKAAAEATWRNPEAFWKIMSISILITAFAEAIAIYAFVIAFMIKGL